jgi:NAD(P)-dependent dehydrogenase (short-subunit alcohol dehydrogenase family)
MRVKDKVAIVTGGASGIGAACARTLAREGAKVVVTDIDERLGGAVVKEIAKATGEAVFVRHDVTQEAQWPAVIEAAEKRFKGLHIMVANAGIGIMVPQVWDMSLADWQRQQAINLDGVFLSVKHAVPAMQRAGGKGSIVVISSVAGLRGSPGLAAYCATKGGVRLLAKAVAMECAQAGLAIRVNSVHPGIIDTPIWGKIPTGAARANAPIDPHERAKAAVPAGFAGAAQDIADGVLFLASEESRYMTGTELVIDGGITAGGFARRTD